MPALAIAVAGGAIVALLRSLGGSRQVTASFLRYASIGAVVFVVQFLWLSPVGSQFVRPAGAVDEQAASPVVEEETGIEGIVDLDLHGGAPPCVSRLTYWKKGDLSRGR